MSSYKYITNNVRASYHENDGDCCFSLYLDGKPPCGFVNARITPAELKGICEYLLKEIEKIENKVKE